MAEHASQAVLGYGTQIAYGVPTTDPTSGQPGEEFTNLHDVVTADPPDEQGEDVEVSHFESPDKTKEYIQGWNDTGSPTFELNWNPAVWADHQQIIADKLSGVKRLWRITLPDVGGESMEVITFPAYIKGIKRTLDPKGAVKATITMKSDAATSVVPEIS